MRAPIGGITGWVEVAEGSPFPLWNLPLGIGHDGDGDGRWRAWVAIGEMALDLAAVQQLGLLDSTGLPDGAFAEPCLNRYLGAGRGVWRAVRERLTELLTDARHAPALAGHLRPQAEVAMGLPVQVGDYVDFYSSIHHATNLGRLFRPGGEPLLPNWRHLPVGYHGRAGSLVPDGSGVVRPSGLRLVEGAPVFGPTAALDIELEVGTVVGTGSELGRPIPIAEVAEHLYGMCLVNDWSARDVQAYEYQPLGPFLGKSFATSMSPWLVSFEALQPFRVAAVEQDPPPAAYLTTDEPWGFDLHLEVWLESAAMRAQALAPVCLSRVGFADMYWTPAQQLAHLTANGAAVRPGDLFASGTVSGPLPGSEGSLIELTWQGARPLSLPDGTTRSFLLDGDRVTLRGWAGNDPATRIGLGSVSGTVLPATTPGGG